MARAKTSTGGAGAFFVAAQLALHDWPVSLTYGNTPRTDLLAQVGDDKLPAAIQVKTKSEGVGGFHAGGIQSPSAPRANEWVVLVALNASSLPDYFVIPRDHVVATVQALLVANPASAKRLILGPHEFEPYQNDWDQLHKQSWEAEWRVADWVWGWRDQITWPPDHPGMPPR